MAPEKGISGYVEIQHDHGGRAGVWTLGSRNGRRKGKSWKVQMARKEKALLLPGL
jgi:hypothetical protein